MLKLQPDFQKGRATTPREGCETASALPTAAALRVSHTASQHMQASWDTHGRTENERRNMAGSVRSSSSAAGQDTRSPDGGDGSWDRPDSSRPTDIEALMTRQPQQLLRLDLSSCGLSSLAQFRAGMAALRRLRHLDISKNAITSLRPVRALPSLESIICSNNSLKVLDGLDECPQLTRITAADNMIASIGDLRALLRLRTLGLRGNQLSSVAALPHHLPTGLHELDLANNELGNLSDLRYVSSLMEMRRLDLRANPLASMAHMQSIDYRPFVVFLLPRLSLLDNTAITRDEWTASRCLFAEVPGVLSEALMALLQPANEKQLRRYLAEKCPMAEPEASGAGGDGPSMSQDRGRRTLVDAKSAKGPGDKDVTQANVAKYGPMHRQTGDVGRGEKRTAQGKEVLLGRVGDRERRRDRQIPATKGPPFSMDWDGVGHGQDAEMGEDVVDVAVLAKHVKEMRKYFKAYIKGQSKRRTAAAQTLQRALRCHWARHEAVYYCCAESKTGQSQTRADGRAAMREEKEGLDAIRTSTVVCSEASFKVRMSIRHVCAVRLQGVVRGMLVRSRLRRWRLHTASSADACAGRAGGPRRAEALCSSGRRAHSKGIIHRPEAHLALGTESEIDDNAELSSGRPGLLFPQWIVKPSQSLGRGGQAWMGGGALEEVIEGLRAELDRERAARQKQDDALRLLWNEVSSLRTSQQTKAAVLIQKMWRGHDDRALYSVALAHFRAYKHARETATRKLQRAARRWFSRVFGAMFRCRWRACVDVQRVFRGHRERKMHDSSLRTKFVQLQAELKWVRDVELLRLERTMLAIQDAMDHVLEAVGPLSSALPASASSQRERERLQAVYGSSSAEPAASNVTATSLLSNESPRPPTPDMFPTALM